MIERVQSGATKLVPKISNVEYEECLEALSHTALADRRLREDAIQMFNFMREINEIDKSNRFQVIQTQARSHSFKYHREISKKQHRYNFLIEQQMNGILCQIIWYMHIKTTALKHNLIAG